MDFGHFIWMHRGQSNQIRTNMPGIGSVIREIAFETSRIVRKQKTFCMVKPMGAF